LAIVAAVSTSGTDAVATVWARAYFHAALLRRVLEEINGPTADGTPQSTTRQRTTSRTTQRRRALTNAEVVVAETVASNEFTAAWAAFAMACRAAGWDLTRTTLQSQGYEMKLVAEE
jgi:hypothetical protein